MIGPAVAVSILVFLALVVLLLYLHRRRAASAQSSKLQKEGTQLVELQRSTSIMSSGSKLDADAETGLLGGPAAGYLVPSKGAGATAPPPDEPEPAVAAAIGAPGALADLADVSVAYVDLNFNTDDKPLGHGNFGVVFLGQWHGQQVAVKQVRASVVTSTGADKVLAEVRVMMSLNMKHHANLVHLVGVCMDHPPDLYLVVEYCPLGSLDYALHKTSSDLHKQLRALPVRRQLALDVVSGMELLHRSGILHGDLAARNVLLRHANQRIVACVSDFGLATKLKSGTLTADTSDRLVPARWTAPEILAGTAAFQRASDVWSYGVVLYELHSLGAVKEPYAGMTNAQVVEYVVQKRGVLPKPAKCPALDYGLMKQCWAFIPEQRPAMHELRRSLEVIALDTGGK